MVLADGSEVPVACAYLDWEDGAHQWAVLIPAGVAPMSMSIGMLPGRTAIWAIARTRPPPTA